MSTLKSSKTNSFSKFLSMDETDSSRLNESEQLDAEIDKDIDLLKKQVITYREILEEDDSEDDFSDYIQEKLDRAMEDLMEILDMDDEEELEDFLNDEEDNEIEVPSKSNKIDESYNPSEMTEVLIAIKNGQLKTIFNIVKEKENVTFLDVAKVLLEKNKPEYLLRLIEMAVYGGHLKI